MKKIDGLTILVGVAVVFSVGFASGYNTKDAKLDDCVEVARQTDYFGPSIAGQAMAFAECARPKTYRLRQR